MSPNETLTSEKYKQQALNSLDSSYGIILKNGAFEYQMIDLILKKIYKLRGKI